MAGVSSSFCGSEQQGRALVRIWSPLLGQGQHLPRGMAKGWKPLLGAEPLVWSSLCGSEQQARALVRVWSPLLGQGQQLPQGMAKGWKPLLGTEQQVRAMQWPQRSKSVLGRAWSESDYVIQLLTDRLQLLEDRLMDRLHLLEDRLMVVDGQAEEAARRADKSHGSLTDRLQILEDRLMIADRQAEEAIRRADKYREAFVNEVKLTKRYMVENVELQIYLISVSNRLKQVNDEVLQLKGMRHLRGAIEYICDVYARENPNWLQQKDDQTWIVGKQRILNAIGRTPEFRRIKELIEKKYNIKDVEWENCYSRIYFSASKQMHEFDTIVQIHAKQFPMSAERAIIAALLHFGNVNYMYVDETGEVVDSPYDECCTRWR